MPWTPEDANAHKHGLSARQRRQWAAVANNILQTCLDDGGAQSACEGRAIRGANAAVGDPEVSANARQSLLTFLASTVPPTRLTLNTREYLVAPGVLLVEGVLNGGYVPGESLVATDWDGIPVVIDHPRDAQGDPVSARDPAVLAAHGVGYLYHAQLSSGRRQQTPVRSLRAEIWLDIAQVQALGGAAVQAMTMIETQQPLEVSTGFYSVGLPQTGTAYGTPYTEILTDLHPDHLALLPNGIGACSWDNGGCGVPRLNTQTCPCSGPSCTCAPLLTEELPMPTAPLPEEAPRGWRGFLATFRQWLDREERVASSPDAAVLHTAAEPVVPARESEPDGLTVNQTDADWREALYSSLAREMGTDWTPLFIDSIDVTNQAFVYRQGERLLQRRWFVDALGILQLDPNAEDVQRNTSFVVVPGTSGPVQDPEDDNSHPDLPGMMAAFATTPRCPSCQHFLTTTATGQRCVQCHDGPQVQAAMNRCPDCGGLVDMTPDVNGMTPTECPSCGAPLTTLTMQERMPMSTPLPVSPLAIKARVNNLILNKQYGWGERDRTMLEAMPEAALIRLESQPVIVPPAEPPAAAEPPKTAIEAIMGMPSHLQDMFMQMHQDYQGRRQAALGVLLANKACPFDQDALQAMSLETLERLVSMGAGVEYTGRGLPAVRTLEVREEPPPPPDVMGQVILRQKAQGLR